MHVYRKLVPAEIGAFHNHLLRLSPQDRQCRFSGSVSDEAVAAHRAGIDWMRSVVIGCLVDGDLRGAAELRFDDPRVGWRCEIAVTVEQPWQDRGIGTELLRRSIVTCQNRSIRSLYMICLLDNRRMQRVARKFEGRLDFSGGDVAAQIALPFATQFTVAAELLNEGAAWMFTWWAALEALARRAPPAA